jgi:hypothetical protein
MFIAIMDTLMGVGGGRWKKQNFFLEKSTDFG